MYFNQHPAWRRYLVAGLVVAVAGAIRAWILPELGGQVPYVTLYPAVMLAALYGGWGGGAVATVLSAVMVVFWKEPLGQPFIQGPADWLGLGVFLAGCGLVSAIGEALHRAWFRALKAEADARAQAKIAFARTQAQESDRKLKLILDTMADGFVALDREWRYTHANPMAGRFLRKPPEELLGNRIWDLFPETATDPTSQQLRRTMDERVPVTFEQYCADLDVWYESRCLPTPEGLVIFFTDIAERKSEKEALRQSEEQFRAFFHTPAVGAAQIDIGGKFASVNDRLCELTGYSREELLGMTPLDLSPPEDQADVQEALAAFMNGELPLYKVEKRFRRRDGTIIWVEAAGALIRDSEGKPLRAAAVFLDITERKRGEEHLRRSEEFLAQAVRVAGLGVFEHDHRTDIIHYSEKAREISGFPGNEVMFSQFLEHIHPEDRERTAAEIRRAHDPRGDGLYAIERRMLMPDGSVRWVSVRSQTFFEGEGDARHAVRTIGAVLDTTERKRAEENLARQKDRLEMLSDTAAHLLFTEEPATAIKLLFQKLSQRFQVDTFFNYLVTDEGDGLWLHSYAGIPPNLARRISRLKLDQALCAAPLTRQAVTVTNIAESNDPQTKLLKDFGLRAFVCHPLLAQDRLLGTLSFGSRIKNEFSQDELEFFRILCSYMSLALDRWRLLQEANQRAADLEERVAERTTRLQQTVHSLEGVLYHVAHDLRAPLRAMHSFAKLLLVNYAPKLDPTGEDYARRIIAASTRMDELTRDLLLYGRLGHQTVTRASVDLNTLFGEVLRQVNGEITRQKASIQIDKPLPRVWADAKILEQVLINLLSNALKFVAPNTPPRVHIWADVIENSVLLSIQDNGIGIDPEFHERIFGIFERLHDPDAYPGTGIGLAIVKKGMDLLEGEVQLESQAGQGSRFIVNLKPISPLYEPRHP